MSRRRIYRQGDVILEEMDEDCELRGRLEKYGKLVSNYLEIAGETGNKHVLLNAKVYNRFDEVYIVLDKHGAMMHKQHPPLKIEPGIYRLRFVRDWLLRDSETLD
ncbi:MAG: hypothetical protein QXJ22_00780 [Ignisphaera sp.]